MGRPIVTNGEFVALLCGNVCNNRAAVLGGKWGLAEDRCVR